eukprot:184277_1
MACAASIFLLFLLSNARASSPSDIDTSGVFLQSNDLKYLLDEAILTESQISYLYDHYYHEFTEPNQETTSTSFSLYNIPSKIYELVSNSLHGIGCLVLTSSYILFMYASWEFESAYGQILITLAYFYIFHMMLHLVVNTVISIIFCMCCCLMPTILVIIYLCDPYFLNGIVLLTELFINIKHSLFIDGIPEKQRYDQFLASIIPKKVFICVMCLNGITILTSTIYLITLHQHVHIQFTTLCVYCFCLYSLLMIFSLYSVQSPKINAYINKFKITKSKYCDVRYIYASIIYWIVMFLICFCTTNNVLFTVCLVSGLNIFQFSFPVFLFIDIFNLNFNEYLDTFKQFFVGDEKGSIESLKIVLGLLQKHDMKYRAFIIVNIMIHMMILEMSVLYSLWIPMPYSALSLFVLSFSIKTDMKWALSLHLPITYSLLKSCFVFISVIDIAPDKTSLWILIILIRSMISIIACFQIDRAISWLTMTMEEWREIEDLKSQWIRIGTHGFTSYFICCLLLYFGDLEENYLISWLFVLFGISYGATLLISIGDMLCTANYCLAFFIIHLAICLRLYVICCDLWIAKLIAFLAALVTFVVLDDAEHMIYPNCVTTEKEQQIAMISAIVLYVSYGWLYECNWLIIAGNVVFCFFMFRQISNKCIALIIVFILAIALFQTGFIFELSFFGVQEGDMLQTMEFSMLQYYFEKIAHS